MYGLEILIIYYVNNFTSTQKNVQLFISSNFSYTSKKLSGPFIYLKLHGFFNATATQVI